MKTKDWSVHSGQKTHHIYLEQCRGRRFKGRGVGQRAKVAKVGADWGFEDGYCKVGTYRGSEDGYCKVGTYWGSEDSYCAWFSNQYLNLEPSTNTDICSNAIFIICLKISVIYCITVSLFFCLLKGNEKRRVWKYSGAYLCNLFICDFHLFAILWSSCKYLTLKGIHDS